MTWTKSVQVAYVTMDTVFSRANVPGQLSTPIGPELRVVVVVAVVVSGLALDDVESGAGAVA